ncbi:MAG: hypothetical protein BGO40_10685 [Chryseobacterium sp. 39-10]|nr:helix-turn-helix domain-containing protein [Chryseobacterium sp.]OJV49665.1 MAG: hypothetical protein BGO40_10685 [Chryseobacterium sp. 39-10]
MRSLPCFLILLSACSPLLFSQSPVKETYDELRAAYAEMTVDDVRAMPYVTKVIEKAKGENATTVLLEGYREARQFDLPHKLAYADSALMASLRYGTADDISKDYLSKGIVYYFYQKKYRFALYHYLKAYSYAKNTKDLYHLHKIVYHLGVVKAHLGYYEEALRHFSDCATYYGSVHLKIQHANERYNYKRAYLNSLHQQVVMHRYLHHFDKSERLIATGIALSRADADFTLEHAYFLKCRGIAKFRNGDYALAVADLEQALPEILQRNDFAWAAVLYYYLGQILDARQDFEGAQVYYRKIDSIFDRRQFIPTEVYGSYQHLIGYYQDRDVSRQLYYSHQLLRAEGLLLSDYPYLSEQLHQSYDLKLLHDEKEALSYSWQRSVRIAFLIALAIFSFLLLSVFRYVRARGISRSYNEPDDSIEMDCADEGAGDGGGCRKSFLSSETAQEISKKLDRFERENMFTKKGITEHSVARQLDTNAHYLSVYVNEIKGMSFTTYLATLRIRYITHLLSSETKYLNYTIKALAEECGIRSRQHFSKLFFEINGMRVGDFIRWRKGGER